MFKNFQMHYFKTDGYQKEGQVHIEIQWFGIGGINKQTLNWTIKIPQANISATGM